jgi:hypothetical protein
VVEKALRIARQKDLFKAIAHLEGLGYIKHRADDVADFLHKFHNKIDLEVMGEYLGGKRYVGRGSQPTDMPP